MIHSSSSSISLPPPPPPPPPPLIPTILSLQWKDTVYKVEECVQYLESEQIKLCKIKQFNIESNQIFIQGKRLYTRQDLYDYTMATYNLFIENIVLKEKLPQVQECFISNHSVKFSLHFLLHPIHIISLSSYINQKPQIITNNNIFYWTHYMRDDYILLRDISPSHRPTTPLNNEIINHQSYTLEEISINLTIYSNIFIWYIKQEMIDSKEGRRVKCLPRPFSLQGYHILFDGRGQQTPPSIVNRQIKYISVLYLEDLEELDKLNCKWREKQTKYGDTFLRVMSVPKSEVPVMKSGKPTYYAGNIPMKITFNIGCNMIKIQYCYQKFFLRDQEKKFPLAIW
jgi:hypothetical protein